MARAIQAQLNRPKNRVRSRAKTTQSDNMLTDFPIGTPQLRRQKHLKLVSIHQIIQANEGKRKNKTTIYRISKSYRIHYT